jgi:subtilisin
MSPSGTLQASDVLSDLPNRPLNVLDSMHEDGPKLTEMDQEVATAINRTGRLRAVPEVIYERPNPASGVITPSAQPAAAVVSVVVNCRDSSAGQPIAGLRVVGFHDFAARWGDEGTTDAAGNVTLRLSGTKIERLYVLPDNRYWGAFRQDHAITSPITLQIEPLSPSYSDAIRSLYPSPRFNPASGVRVGVLDTGVGPHADLNVVAGICTATGQPASSYQDIDEHGTHVAGLIGGSGGTGLATRGLALNVPLCAFRVFDWFGGKLGASNYAILKAMIFAATSPYQCDIINLSLGGGPYDPIVEEAVADARNQGMLVVVATGNDGRKAVSYPAAYAGATAISAMGLVGSYPSGCYFEGDVEFPPNGTVDPKEYIADFSNVGPQVACTGLGSGVLSTLPNQSFGPMSGTSMAAPMVAGAAASLLSNNPSVFGMMRNRARSDAIERLLTTKCVPRFGGGNWEGFGLPDPSAV